VLIERQIRHEPLQLPILVLERLQLAQLADARLAADVGRRGAAFDLAEGRTSFALGEGRSEAAVVSRVEVSV
jgi:hypothetical protein